MTASIDVVVAAAIDDDDDDDVQRLSVKLLSQCDITGDSSSQMPAFIHTNTHTQSTLINYCFLFFFCFVIGFLNFFDSSPFVWRVRGAVPL